LLGPEPFAPQHVLRDGSAAVAADLANETLLQIREPQAIGA